MTAQSATAPTLQLPHTVVPVTFDVDVRYRNQDHRFPNASDSQPFVAPNSSSSVLSRVATEETHSSAHSSSAVSDKGAETPWGVIGFLLVAAIAVGFVVWLTKGEEIRQGWNRMVGPPAASAPASPTPAASLPSAPATTAPAAQRLPPAHIRSSNNAVVVPTDHVIRYTGNTCTRSDGSTGAQGYTPSGQIACYRW